MTSPTPTDPRKGLIVISTASFLVPFMGSALNLALPRIAEAFSMKAVSMTWLATAYLIASAIFQIPFARLADLIGRKKVFTIGVAGFSVCTALCGVAVSEEMLLAMRFLSGVGSAMIFGSYLAILTAIFPPQQRGKALGINTAVVYAALAAGPLLGGLLTDYLGWQSLFFACAGVGLLVLLFTRLFLHGEWVEARGEKFDYLGSLLYALGLSGVIYGFSFLSKPHGAVCLGMSLILLVFFVRYEKRQSSPVLNVRLFFGNRVFTLSALAALINYAATSAIAFMLSLYLQYIRGLDPRHAGLLLISQACVQSLCSLLSGPLSDRIAPSRLATAGMGIIVLGLAGLTFLDADTPYWVLIGLLVLLGTGFGVFSSPNTNVIMSSVPPKDYGQASATTGTMRLTGQAFSMGIAGMAIALGMGNHAITPELHGAFLSSMRLTFIVFLGLCVVGVYASSARVK